jgi:hypothetical protein
MRGVCGSEPERGLRPVFTCYGFSRGGSIAEIQKRRRGRPATGSDPVRTIRLSAELEARITDWIERQPDPKPRRSEAIRRLIESGLRS